jgi:hypothetical protein
VAQLALDARPDDGRPFEVLGRRFDVDGRSDEESPSDADGRPDVDVLGEDAPAGLDVLHLGVGDIERLVTVAVAVADNEHDARIRDGCDGLVAVPRLVGHRFVV